MLGVLRTYLYCVVLAGFLAHPLLGLKSVLPALLTTADLLLIAGCGLQIVLGWTRLQHGDDRQPLRRVLLVLALVVGYGLALTAQQAGAVAEAAKYLGALARGPLMLMALYVALRTGPMRHPAPLYRALRFDFALLAGAQMAVATLQLTWPAAGADFLGDFTEGHSSRAALEEGDVSGTFPNSIDLAYFLLASYVTLTLGAWRRGRAPALWTTALFGFFIEASGSLAATVCFGLYAGYLHARAWTPPVRWTLAFALALACLGTAFVHFDAIAEAVIDKIDNMMLSRLGLLFVSLPTIAESQPLRLLTGSGLDFEVVLGVLRDLPEVPLVFAYDDAAVVINDVFWAALVLGLGAPLVALALARLAGLLRALLGADTLHPTQHNLWRVLLLVLVLAGVINQILLVRPFTVGLLLALAPLALSHAQRRRANGPLSS